MLVRRSKISKKTGTRKAHRRVLPSWALYLLWGVPIAAMPVCRYIVWPLYVVTDIESSAPRHAHGLVVSVIRATITRGNWSQASMVTVRVGNAEFTSYTLLPLFEGENVDVKYRVGKSGRAYVDSVEPETP